MAGEIVNANSYAIDSLAYGFEFNQASQSVRITEKDNSNLSFLVWGDPHQSVQVKNEHGAWQNSSQISHMDFYTNRSYMLEDGTKVEMKTVPGQGVFAGGAATFTNEVIITSADGKFAVHVKGLYRDHELAQGRDGQMSIRVIQDDTDAARALDTSSSDGWVFGLTDGKLDLVLPEMYASIREHLLTIVGAGQRNVNDLLRLQLDKQQDYFSGSNSERSRESVDAR